MKKLWFLVLPVVFVGSGCTTLALERQTVNQSQSAADYRYQATLHCLAMVAAQPDTLPSYALLSNGTTSLTDSGILNPTFTWSGAPLVYAATALGVTVSRSPMVQWTVSPVADDTQLQAMRCACRWVLDGPEHLDANCAAILADPEDPAVAKLPGPHFGVLARLERLPQGWLHCGPLCEVPATACYKNHCGDKWVWVMPDGLEGLAGFTLVLQDIATLLVAPTDGTLPQNLTPPLFVTLWSVQSTLPRAEVVVINIKRNGNDVVYPKQTEVMVGQYVVWHNADSDGKSSHAAANKVPGLFDTDTIPNGASSKPILFDDTMFANAGGYTKNGMKDKVLIDYSEKNQANIKSQILLKPSPYTNLYSPTLVFREDRVIRPEFKKEIEDAIKKQVTENPAQAVDIKWENWQSWTTPYQAQRTAAKPGSAQALPITIPPNRLFRPQPTSIDVRAFVGESQAEPDKTSTPDKISGISSAREVQPVSTVGAVVRADQTRQALGEQGTRQQGLSVPPGITSNGPLIPNPGEGASPGQMRATLLPPTPGLDLDQRR